MKIPTEPTCPGGDQDSTHSADVPYTALLPSLFQLDVSSFFLSLASEPDRIAVLEIVAAHLRPGLETPEEVCARVLEAARHIPLNQLGTTDDCGFAPFCDDKSTSRELAFAKIHARVSGTALAAKALSSS